MNIQSFTSCDQTDSAFSDTIGYLRAGLPPQTDSVSAIVIPADGLDNVFTVIGARSTVSTFLDGIVTSFAADGRAEALPLTLAVLISQQQGL